MPKSTNLKEKLHCTRDEILMTPCDVVLKEIGANEHPTRPGMPESSQHLHTMCDVRNANANAHVLACTSRGGAQRCVTVFGMISAGALATLFHMCASRLFCRASSGWNALHHVVSIT